MSDESRAALTQVAALAVVNADGGKVEMDPIHAQLLAMSQEEAGVTRTAADEMNSAYGTALVSSMLAGVLNPPRDDRQT